MNLLVSLMPSITDNDQYMSVAFPGWNYSACIYRGSSNILLNMGCQTVIANMENLQMIAEADEYGLTERDIKLFKLIMNEFFHVNI